MGMFVSFNVVGTSVIRITTIPVMLLCKFPDRLFVLLFGLLPSLKILVKTENMIIDSNIQNN